MHIEALVTSASLVKDGIFTAVFREMCSQAVTGSAQAPHLSETYQIIPAVCLVPMHFANPAAVVMALGLVTAGGLY